MLGKHFKIKDLGNLAHFLGQELIRTEKGIMLTPRRCAKDVLQKFGMWESA
jgi:hypothetical protein